MPTRDRRGVFAHSQKKLRFVSLGTFIRTFSSASFAFFSHYNVVSHIRAVWSERVVIFFFANVSLRAARRAKKCPLIVDNTHCILLHTMAFELDA